MQGIDFLLFEFRIYYTFFKQNFIVPDPLTFQNVVRNQTS